MCEDLKDPFRVVDIAGDVLKGDPARLADEFGAMSLMGGRRVIRVRPAGEESATALREPGGRPAGDALIVIEGGNLTPRSSLRTLAETEACLAALPCYMDNEAALERLVESAARAQGLAVEDDALDWIVERLGGDRGQSRSEVDKLLLYKAGDGAKAVSLDDALAVLGDTAAIGIDDVVAATFDGDLVALDRALDRVFAEGGNPVQLVRALQRHTDQLHLVSGHVANGGNLEGGDVQGARPAARRTGPATLRASRAGWPLAGSARRAGASSRPSIECKIDRLSRRGDRAPAVPGASVVGTRRGEATPLALLARDSERHGSLLGQHQEGEALLDVEPYAFGIVFEVADREILADRELEVAAAHRQDQAAIEASRPDDVAVDQALDVAQDGIAAVGARREILVELLVQNHGEGAFDALVAQFGEGCRHRARIVGMAGAKRHRGRRRGLADPGDVRRLVAVEDRPILGDRDLTGRRDDEVEVGITRAAVDGIEFRARHFKGDAQFNQGLDAAQPRLHVRTARRGSDRIGATELDVEVVPTQWPAKFNDAPRRQHAAQGPLGFLLDFFPAGFGDRRAIAEKMVLHLPFSVLALRKLPMPRLPSGCRRHHLQPRPWWLQCQ